MLNNEIRDLGLINHINDYCDDIERTHQRFNNDYSRFATETTYERTVAFDIMQICELTKRLSEEFKDAYNLPWRAIAGMRNVIVHDYGSIDTEVLWSTSHEDIQQIKEMCDVVLAPYVHRQEEQLDEDIEERVPKM